MVSNWSFKIVLVLIVQIQTLGSSSSRQSQISLHTSLSANTVIISHNYAIIIVAVKLKWISNSSSQDRETGADEQRNGSAVASDEYKMVKARAGESLVFECNASGGQPRPRVRWYRLVPAGGTTGAKIAPFAKTLGHLAGGPQPLMTTTRAIGPDVAVAHTLDEVQMRAMLEKFKSASRGDTLPFYRYELVNRNNGKIRYPVSNMGSCLNKRFI